MDTMATTSLTSRRQAAASLPQFSLPSPSSEIPSTRYPCHLPPIISPSRNDSRVGPHEATAAAPSTAATPTTSSTCPNAIPSSQPIPQASSTIPSSRTISIASSSILTPTSGISSDGLSPSSGANSSGSQSTQGGGGLYYHHPQMTTGSWPPATSQNSAYTYAHPNSTSGSSPVVPQPYPQRQTMYEGVSPSMPQFSGRTSSSSTNGDNLPNPTTYQGQSPFPTPLGSSGGATLGSSFSQAPGAPAHAALSHPMLNSHNPSVTQPPTPTQQARAPMGLGTQGQEGQTYRPPPTPNSYYPPSSTPQQSSFPAFSGQPHQSPATHSPTTSSGNSSRGLGALSSGMGPSLPYGSTRGPHMPSLGSYVPPYQMPGPVMSNVHHPGTPLSIVGGMHGLPYHQMAGHGHHMYSSHGPPPGDRPFKCDQCPQSFNRNHDLKRHKRIHLAVKPFPCTYCDKSFSRKDALKRHKLVKGCGSNSSRGAGTNTGSPPVRSPPDRSDAASEDTADNVTPKREQYDDEVTKREY